MSDLDERLERLFALDQPPSHDPAFVLEIARAMHRRRLVLDWLAGAPWMIAASAVCWVGAPWLQSVSGPLALSLRALAPAIAIGAGVLFVAAPRLMAPSRPPYRDLTQRFASETTVQSLLTHETHRSAACRGF